jgi:hypothetical protein
MLLLPHKAIALQSQAAPQALYILPYTVYRSAHGYAKFKRPFPAARGLPVLPSFRPKLEGDEE